MKNNKPLKIARIVSIPLAFVHVKKIIGLQKERDCKITLISQDGDYVKELDRELGLPHIVVDIQRGISLKNDLLAVFKLYKIFKKNKFDIIHSSTPKAGLVCALAGYFARIPVRIHTFTGQRWATEKGWFRSFLKKIDYLISLLSTHVYTDSPSQTAFLKDERVVIPNKVTTIHNGSYGGIDLVQFDQSKYLNRKEELKKELNLDPESKTLLFMGRLTKDKGVEELVRAFKNLRDIGYNINLVLIGFYDLEYDPIAPDVAKIIDEDNHVHFLGFKNNPEYYLAGADIFCMPSYREGFGTVVLEAAAMGVPTVGTDIPGLKDAIIDGETGILSELHNMDELMNALEKLITNDELRIKYGEQAKIRAMKDFNPEILEQKLWEDYQKFLEKV